MDCLRAERVTDQGRGFGLAPYRSAMNHHHERELTHLVAEHDRAYQAKEFKLAHSLAARIFMRYGYKVRAEVQPFEPKLVKT